MDMTSDKQRREVTPCKAKHDTFGIAIHHRQLAVHSRCAIFPSKTIQVLHPPEVVPRKTAAFEDNRERHETRN